MGFKVVTGIGRFSYAYVFEPRKNDKGELTYSTAFIWPKSDTKTTDDVRKAIAAAKEEGKATKWGGKIPDMREPLKDGDIKHPDDPAYKDSWFINANAKEDRAPGVVDKNRNPIIDKSQFYSGCYGRMSVNFYPFNVGTNKGIGIGLSGVQKLRDGEPLGSVFSADVDFGDDIDVLSELD